MADPVTLAQDMWDASRGDIALEAAILAQRKTLIAAIASGASTGTVVQGSKNGSTYTLRPDVSMEQRRAALQLFARAVDCGVRPSRNRRTCFL